MNLIIDFIKLTLQLSGWFFLGKALAFVIVWCLSMTLIALGVLFILLLS